VNKAASVRPLDHAQAALWYRKALASTLEGVYPRELRRSRLGRVSHMMHMLGRRLRSFSTLVACVPRLALVRPRWRCAGGRSSRLIRLSEGGERREDNRGP
jgi:hypothetical protein